MNRKILCVDDEEAILKGFRLNLRKDFELFTANCGEEGVEVFQTESPFAVVLSDMRMPGMDGASMLAEIKQLDPDVVSMLLTGHADFDSAMAAVNDGRIFRMLAKPCPPDRLKQALEDGLRQHELVISEKVLLEQTLKGAIDALTQALATAKPLFFGRAMRIRRLSSELAEMLGEDNIWRIEVAAIFSQLASITLPESVA
ncbi:MAG: response regulator, partial [Opitutales bacterium]